MQELVFTPPNKPAVFLPPPGDMDGHLSHLPCAFDQLKDANVTLVQPVVSNELGPALAPEASDFAVMVVPDTPHLFFFFFF